MPGLDAIGAGRNPLDRKAPIQPSDGIVRIIHGKPMPLHVGMHPALHDDAPSVAGEPNQIAGPAFGQGRTVKHHENMFPLPFIDLEVVGDGIEILHRDGMLISHNRDERNELTDIRLQFRFLELERLSFLDSLDGHDDIQGIEKGKPFEFEETKLETNICQFVPFVSVMRDQHPITVKNLDTIAHDLQVYEREWEHIFMMFHRPTLTKGGTSDLVRFTGNRRGVIMQCGMHPYMQGHGLAVDNPYYAITGLDGSFAIKELPAGTYRIKAWHPILGEKVQDVMVAANGTASLGFRFKAK